MKLYCSQISGSVSGFVFIYSVNLICKALTNRALVYCMSTEKAILKISMIIINTSGIIVSIRLKKC